MTGPTNPADEVPRHSDAAAEEGSPTPPAESRPARAGKRDPLRSSATSRSWLMLVSFALVLVLLVVFIAQNTSKVPVTFLGWTWHPPLAVALLASVAAGLLLAVISGSLRIVQLRRRVHRDTKRARS